MAGRLSSRAKWTRALIALGVVLAYPADATLVCTLALASDHAIAADAQPVEKTKPDRDCQKRTEGQRTSSGKPCVDGGERLPQDRSRSPLDRLPPLAPLVA
jgi:hypothetical protein